jgi:group I intron endonuclease
MGYIYLITNKINGKQYIGQTLREEINDRWKQHLNKKSIGRCLKSAYLKYGVENFNFKIICICFDEDCNKYEKEYIIKFNTISPNGYNLSEGGDNKCTHIDTKKLISEKLTGRKLSLEQCEKIKNRMTGSKNHNYGKNLSDKTKELLRQKAIQRGNTNLILTDEQKERRNKGLEFGVEKNKKKVAKYDKNNNFIEKFSCITEASKKCNITHTTISNVCNNIKYYKTAGGFIWKFI